MYKGTHISLSDDFSAETLQARREWHGTFKVLKGKTLQPRMLYPARLSFRIEGDKDLLRQAKTERVHQGTYLAVQWLRVCAPSAGGMASIPGQGTKIPHPAHCMVWPSK